MAWGERQSLNAQMGALRTQLDMAERAAAKANARAVAWKEAADAWDQVWSVEDDDEFDAAVNHARGLRAIAEALEP